MKQKILDYLQQNSLELRKRFPTLNDAFFEDNPEKLVLTFEEIPKGLKKLDKELGFKIEVRSVDSKALPVLPKVAEEDENIKKWKNRHKNANLTEAYTGEIKDSISPFSKSGDIGAYEAWKKRNNIK